MSDTKTVYFLGAGASKASDFNLPVMNGFFRKDDFPENGREYQDLKKFIERFYSKANKIEWNKVNLEEILTHLELTMEGFNWGLVDSGLHDTKTQLFQYIKYRLGKPVENKVCKKHLKLFEKFRPDTDSIITLNYDLVVDNSLKDGDNETKFKDFLLRYTGFILWKMAWGGVNPLVYKSNLEKGILVKLHGSLDWIYCPRSGCPMNNMFWKSNMANDPCYLCGTSLEFAIVPPTMKKSFEKFPKLGFLWHLAFNKLKEADKVVVIGMSFPDSDYYLKWLVRQAMMVRGKFSNKPLELVIVNKKRDDQDAIFEETVTKTKNIFMAPDVPDGNIIEGGLKEYVNKPL